MRQNSVFLIFIFLLVLPISFASDCPYGYVDDPYVRCGLYVDTNSDHLCDLSQEPVKTVEVIQPIIIKPRYEFVGVSIILTIIYLVSFFLYRFNKITVVLHRRIWNILLLLTFLVSAILGILLVIRINYGVLFDFLPFNMLYWHVEAGIAMTIISLFHIGWHWRYYLSYFKKDDKVVKTARKKK